MKNVHLIYFSPAFSTKSIVCMIGKSITESVIEYDITQGLDDELSFNSDDLVIMGVPVYAGRVPGLAAKVLKKMKGDQTPTIIVSVYGNRDYDDALLELQEMIQTNHFSVIGAGAFIARHSIFPEVATGRPDKEDNLKIIEFARKCLEKYELGSYSKAENQIRIKGNKPFKEPSKIPLYPKGDRKCNKCGTCVRMCPTSAISMGKPRKTDKELCITCTRCIEVCPQKARHFTGLIFRIASKKFVSKYSDRKEPEIFL